MSTTEATTAAQTNTEAATEVNAGAQTLLGEDAGSATEQQADEAVESQEAKPSAPEKYEFKLPEGVTLDEEAFKVFEPALRELDLTNESAQKLIDKYTEVQQAQAKAEAAAQEKAFTEQIEKWAADAKADKEYGGQAFEANRSAALKAIGKYGSPELKNLLNLTGLGNHPEFVRFCVRVGKSLSEDNPINPGGSAGGAEKSLEQRLWSNHS